MRRSNGSYWAAACASDAVIAITLVCIYLERD